MSAAQRPAPSRAGRVYGDTVYWGALIGAVVSVVGSVMALLALDNNVLDPAQTFSAIWQGMGVAQIWTAAGGAQPGGHWYLDHLTKGDALAMGGLALAVASVVPALLWSAGRLFAAGDRVYAAVAGIAALFVFAALIGWIALPG